MGVKLALSLLRWDRLRGFEKRVLSKQFGPNGEEIQKEQGGGKLLNENLYDLHSALNIICDIKSGMMIMMIMIIFIYCNWVSTQWQWSVVLYKNRKETAQKEKQYTTTQKQYKNTEYTKL